MPPKKVEEPEKKPLIGRVGTNLRVGIVGKQTRSLNFVLFVMVVTSFYFL